jgi:hypothetical protein
MLLAIFQTPDAAEGMTRVLRLVARRMVVGNLGTGSVERRFSDAAQQIEREKSWQSALNSLSTLDPLQSEFVEQLRKRSFNKGTLAFMRRSILQQTMTPESTGVLYYIRPRHAPDWWDFNDEQFTFWGSTLGNTFLAEAPRRPFGAADWAGFGDVLLPYATTGEIVTELGEFEEWNEGAVESVGKTLAKRAGSVWYD